MQNAERHNVEPLKTVIQAEHRKEYKKEVWATEEEKER
jgi:hypothetical protein